MGSILVPMKLDNSQLCTVKGCFGINQGSSTLRRTLQLGLVLPELTLHHGVSQTDIVASTRALLLKDVLRVLHRQAEA